MFRNIWQKDEKLETLKLQGANQTEETSLGHTFQWQKYSHHSQSSWAVHKSTTRLFSFNRIKKVNSAEIPFLSP